MTQDVKNHIKDLFLAKAKKLGLSEGKAAIAAGTKGTTISQVFSGKYIANDEGIYKLLAKWVGYENDNWKMVETKSFKFLMVTIEEAKQEALFMVAVGNAGTGKTEAMRYYAQNVQNAFHLRCDEFWNRKQFLAEVLTAMGIDSQGLSLPDLMDKVTRHLRTLDKPVLMIDEADKLANPVLLLFISLFNRLEGECGIVLIATDHLRKKLERGAGMKRKGFEEIWSRAGRRAITIPENTTTDIQRICEANGVKVESAIGMIVRDATGDLRRVKRSVHSEKMSA